MSRVGAISRRMTIAMTLSAVVAFVTVEGMRLQGATERQSQGNQAAVCMDELGRKYSQNAMRRVVDQIQACAAGMWILDPSSPPKDSTPANAKSCHSQRVADKGQEYASGLLRAFDDSSTKKHTIERCDNGTWKKVAKSPTR